jgi:hypothetical protein
MNTFDFLDDGDKSPTSIPEIVKLPNSAIDHPACQFRSS